MTKSRGSDQTDRAWGQAEVIELRLEPGNLQKQSLEDDC